MDKTEILVIAIATVVALIVPLFPGFVLRLIFQKPSKSKLSKFISIPFAMWFFGRMDTADTLFHFSEGYGEADWNILKWLVLFEFFFILLFCTLFARVGISLGDMIINRRKSQQGNREVREKADEIE